MSKLIHPLAPALLLVACGGAQQPGSDSPPPAEGSSAPEGAVMIEEHIETTHLVVTVRPRESGVEDPGPGLRSVDLHVAAELREPHAQWPDGTPVSADAQITVDQVRAVLSHLEGRGFFMTAGRYHSDRSSGADRPPPPEGSEPGPPARPVRPHIVLEISVFDEHYYHYLLRIYELGDEGRSLLEGLAGVVSGEAAALIRQLAGAAGL